MSTRCRALAVFAFALVVAPRAGAQAPSLEDVLRRADSYLRAWVPQLANIVSTEMYEERLITTSTIRPRPRRLKSDVLLVRRPGSINWILFRDVVEVDSRPLTHEPDRLLKLFVSQTADAEEQAHRIAAEGLQYHLPGASASSTNPFLGIALMQGSYQSRLRFRLGDADRSLGPRVRALRFQEREETEPTAGSAPEKLTLLLTDAGRVQGTVWLDVETGEIVKTDARMAFESGPVSTTRTTFARDERLGILVPKEMRTEWRNFSGTAKYSNYRRFEVRTTEVPDLTTIKP
jgi:hypothetical protein